MNCKPGDLAIIKHSPLGQNLNKIVEVVALMGTHSEFGPIWRIKACGRSLVTDCGVVCAACDCPDAWLIPIRDNDGEDEMLCIVGKPEGVSA